MRKGEEERERERERERCFLELNTMILIDVLTHANFIASTATM